MMNKLRRNRNLITDENGDARITAGFVVAGGITFILLAVVLFTDLPPIGPNEGDLAPNLQGEVHHLGASDWVDFELYDEIDSSWDAESSPEAKWFFIQFMDTDCIHCWNEAESMTQLEGAFGDRVTFISVAISLDMPKHSASREEVVAFQEKSSLLECKADGTDCSTRDGEPHDWAYFDDLSQTSSDPWNIEGTPFVVIVKPDGVVAWNQAAHLGEEVGNALYGMLPQVGE
jgi:hypothetical protein